MPILYNARRHTRRRKSFNARYCDLDTLLQEADFVCLILPLTAETHHLFNAEKFAKMKPSAIFINAGRGPVVDEKALISALQKGQIHAAGLDVFEQEPLAKESPLLTCRTSSRCRISVLPLMRPATTWRPARWIID
jgi:gluconate 2-dehydrogenase